jgi:uncharacterized protein YjbI with pentapeptide repeats
MLRDFFKLNGAPAAVRQFGDVDELLRHFNNATSLTNAAFPRDTEFTRQRFRGQSFENVAFSHVTFYETTFTNCAFRDCLFIGTNFEECEFHSCLFENCNTYKFRLSKVYIDPSSFSLDKRYRSIASNVGIDLYQRLYENAMTTH